MGRNTVAVDDDRAAVGEDAENRGSVDVARRVDVSLLFPDDAADGPDDGQHDGGDGGDYDDASAAVGSLLCQAHLGRFGADRIDGCRLLLLSHELTFQT